MTLSAPRTPRSPWFDRLRLPEDGTILRGVFYAMLAGTLWVLLTDYQALRSEDRTQRTGAVGDPVLPAVERPEIDLNDPAYRPHERITTPRDILSAPLTIELGPDGQLALTGTITPGSADAFAREIEQRGTYVQAIRLDSPGGSVDDALAIAALVREKGFGTLVEAGSVCASSCPLILAAGETREVATEASVGVHQIYAASDDAAQLSPAQSMSDAQMITARIARHFEAMGVSPMVWMHALETPPDRLYYLTQDQMREYGLIQASLD